MSTRWLCPSSISSADQGVAHPPRCPLGWSGEAVVARDMPEPTSRSTYHKRQAYANKTMHHILIYIAFTFRRCSVHLSVFHFTSMRLACAAGPSQRANFHPIRLCRDSLLVTAPDSLIERLRVQIPQERRENFLLQKCMLLLNRCPFYPRATAVARKRPRSFCQKWRWHVTRIHLWSNEVGVGWLYC